MLAVHSTAVRASRRAGICSLARGRGSKGPGRGLERGKGAAATRARGFRDRPGCGSQLGAGGGTWGGRRAKFTWLPAEPPLRRSDSTSLLAPWQRMRPIARREVQQGAWRGVGTCVNRSANDCAHHERAGASVTRSQLGAGAQAPGSPKHKVPVHHHPPPRARVQHRVCALSASSSLLVRHKRA